MGGIIATNQTPDSMQITQRTENAHEGERAQPSLVLLADPAENQSSDLLFYTLPRLQDASISRDVQAFAGCP
jgi:hypothetical protein